jgi:hypothetical protein
MAMVRTGIAGTSSVLVEVAITISLFFRSLLKKSKLKILFKKLL